MSNAMQRANKALELHPRCGAFARTTGQPCKGWAMKNGRCRMHGGKAGRKPTHGLFTSGAIELRRQERQLLSDLKALLDVLK